MEISLDRFYYTPDVDRMQIFLAVEAREGVDVQIKVEQTPGAPAVAAQEEIPLVTGQDSYDISFDMRDWALGRYLVSAHLRDAEQKRLRSTQRIFIRREFEPAPPSPSALNATVRSDGILLLEGEPFCPFMAEGWTPVSPLGKDGFNFTTYGDLAALSIADPLDHPRLNLPWVTRVGEETFILMPEKEKMWQDLHEEVLERKTDPALFSRLIKYEAHIPMYRGTAEERTAIDNVSQCREINQFLKELDPDHLTSIHVDRPQYLPQYKDVADIIEVACWSSSYAPSLIPNLCRDLQQIRNVIGAGKPFIFWIGNTIPNPESRTAEEIRAACYLALMYGSAGIWFNMGHGGLDPSFTRHWSVYPGLYRELMEVFAILTTLQPEPAPAIAVDAPEINYRVCQRDGRLYAIAVNTSDRMIQATLSATDRSLLANDITLPFENRSIQPREGRFADAFTAYEAHVYEWAS